MYVVRLWSVRQTRALRRVYEFFSRHAPRLAPLVRRLGVRRSEALRHPVERIAADHLAHPTPPTRPPYGDRTANLEKKIVAGVHVMGHKNKDVPAEIIAESGLGCGLAAVG